MAAMTERRSDFSAVAFADRYILAIGGQNEKREALASVEIYDAQEGCWVVDRPTQLFYIWIFIC